MKKREEAWQLLNEWTKSSGLIKHALAVEALMRHYARKYGEDPEYWGLAGLLHDFDYEKYPQAPDHPERGAAFLGDNNWPPDIIEAILGHVAEAKEHRQTKMAQTLYAVDELSGLIIACALVTPEKKLDKVEAASVLKKMKTPAFARAVSREGIVAGAEELGIDLEGHINYCLRGLREVSGELGL